MKSLGKYSILFLQFAIYCRRKNIESSNTTYLIAAANAEAPKYSHGCSLAMDPPPMIRNMYILLYSLSTQPQGGTLSSNIRCICCRFFEKSFQSTVEEMDDTPVLFAILRYCICALLHQKLKLGDKQRQSCNCCVCRNGGQSFSYRVELMLHDRDEYDAYFAELSFFLFRGFWFLNFFSNAS